MAKEFAQKFYNSQLWKVTREQYAQSRLYLCELCGDGTPGEIVHHKIHLTPKNINSSLATDFSNLQLLCRRHHELIHNGGAATSEGLCFNADGELIESPPVFKSGLEIFTPHPTPPVNTQGHT